MLTLRALPAAPIAENGLLAAYHDGLRRHWTGRRLLNAAAFPLAANPLKNKQLRGPPA